MTYKHGDISVDLSNMKRLYPASVVDLDGDVSEMSLEWTEINEEKVIVLGYVLVFDFTPSGELEKVKTTINFDTKEELIEEMIKVSKLFP